MKFLVMVAATPKNMKSFQGKLETKLYDDYLLQWLNEDKEYNPRGYIAINDGKTVGFILLRDAVDELTHNKCVYIAFIYVCPSARNGKVGNSLLDNVKKAERNNIVCYPLDKSIPFFLKNGFIFTKLRDDDMMVYDRKV